MATINLVYRENDLFQVYVPKIVAFLRKQGYTVAEKAFLRDTSLDEVKRESWELRKAATRDSQFLTDMTCSENFFMPRMLEGFISQGLVPAYLGMETYHDAEDCLKKMDKDTVAKEIFQKIIREVAEKIGTPSLVFADRRNVTDHEPFCQYDKNFNEIRMSENEALDTISSWVRGVFADCEIKVSDGSQEVVQQERSTWHIIDRHGKVGDIRYHFNPDTGSGHPHLRFNLPIVSMLNSLGTLGLLPPLEEKAWPIVADVLGDCFAEANGAG